MINPMQMMMTAMQQRLNPMTYIQQQAHNNPAFRQLSGLIQGKSPEQLRTIAENMAKERGTTLDNVARQLGLPWK